MKKLVSLFLVIIMLLSMAILPAEAQRQTISNDADPKRADLPLNDELNYVWSFGDDYSCCLDSLQVNNNIYSHSDGFAENDVINIDPGDKMFILGWAIKDGTNVDRIIWTVDGNEKECADLYRARPDAIDALNTRFDYNIDLIYAQKSGFGFDDDMMELIGADELANGMYIVSIRAVFEDDTYITIKEDFQLVVGEASEDEVFQCVRFTALGEDPHACFQFSSAGNNDMIDPDNVTWAAIRYKTGSQYDSSGVEYIAQFYIVPSTRPFIPVTYNFTGDWETVIVDMTSVSSITELESKWNSDYYTETGSIRFDPLEPDRDSEQYIISGQDVSEGDYIDIAWIAFFENEEDAIAYTGKEDTPYCLLDTDSLMDLSGEYNLKADLYDSNGNPVQTNDDPDQPEDPPTDPNLRVAACNLSFADSIYIKYAISADDLAGIQLLIWTEPQSEYVYGTQDALLTTIGTETINGTQCAIFQYSKLAAKQMVDNIYARAFVEVNGTRFYSEVKKYSVLQYAYNKTGRTGTASSNPKLITLLNDMLQYGASAQQYLNYKTGRLATMDYYQVKVVGGVLSDMCDSGLYLAGESVVLTAFDTNSEGLPFACWQDSEGNIVGTSITITVTVDMSNEVYTAKYGSFSDYSMFEYESNGDGTCTITVLNAHDSTDIVLPDRAPNGDVVTGIGVGAFAGEDITSVTIPISVTSIGKNAFKGCDELTDVYYAGTLAQWDTIAIAAGNEPLLTAELHCAADGSEGLAYEDNGDGTCTITGIGTCTDTDVIIPNEIYGLRVTKIGYCAFYYNTKITSIKLSENIVTVEGSAFRQCENLKNATILNCDVRIGEEAFAYGGLSDIYFNGTYEQWDYAVLPSQSYNYNYNNVKIHTINTESIGLSYEDNGDGTCTITGIGGCSDNNVYIPWYIGDLRVTAIGDRAFENQSGLTEIHIPNSVKSIGTRAFYGCTGLTEMAIPRSVTSIGTQIFYKASNIHTVYYNAQYWPDENDNQFLNNSSIKKVVFGGYRIGGNYSVVSRSLGLTRNVEVIELLDSVTIIGWCAFIDCTNLTSITIPYSVREIYDRVFSGCLSLKNVYYNGTISDWCRITMDSNNWSPCTNPCINGASLFIDGELLTDAIIPDDITSIGWSAFAGCTSLTSITIPDSVASIGEYAFYGCTSLTSITIPDGETSIRLAAFAGCTSLTSITIPDSVTSIQGKAFYNCTSFTSITIPDSVTSIEQEAFYNCASLGDIYYDGTVDQWENVSKDYSWVNSSLVSVVHCLDGDAPV